MKDLIKKQDEEFDNLFVGVEDDGTFKRMDEANVRNFIAKVRKETAEKVCDKMIGEERDSDESMLSKKCKSRLTAFKAVMDFQGDLGYNHRIEEEKEIKQQILKEIN